jgi:hypothetical protein
MKHTSKDFKENQWVICSKAWCAVNGGKKLNTSTITSIPGKGAVNEFPGWNSFRTVLEACQKNPSYFTIVDEVINNYEIY